MTIHQLQQHRPFFLLSSSMRSLQEGMTQNRLDYFLVKQWSNACTGQHQHTKILELFHDHIFGLILVTIFTVLYYHTLKPWSGTWPMCCCHTFFQEFCIRTHIFSFSMCCTMSCSVYYSSVPVMTHIFCMCTVLCLLWHILCDFVSSPLCCL